jgi:hypothetical protein
VLVRVDRGLRTKGGKKGKKNKKKKEGNEKQGDILVDEVGVLGVVEVDLVGLVGLPVGGKDDYGLGLDLLGDLLADGLEDRVDGVGGVVLDIGLGCVS